MANDLLRPVQPCALPLANAASGCIPHGAWSVAFVHDQLTTAGWLVEWRLFDVCRRIGSTNRHGHRALALKARSHRRLCGALGAQQSARPLVDGRA
ncbi:hypothetical protein V2W30_40480 (plasmid) [Streptomyces sp. Q6]|uniref:Uncharacterized protein n=1 Tax=Streptomyces citrinus TaxID=3118173 RepID=A0ACD5AQI1_9ACTN